MRLPSPAIVTVLCALTWGLGGCGEDHDGGGASGGGTGVETSDPPPGTSDPPADTATTPPVSAACAGTPDQPIRVPATPPGLVVACSSADGRTLSVSNVSSQVLRFEGHPPGSVEMELTSTPESAGDEAAMYISGAGDQQRGDFVLPLGGAMVVTSASPPVSVDFAPDLQVSGQALVAQYAAEWAAGKLQTRGRALADRVSSCAESAAGVAQPDAYVEDVLRSALGGGTCVGLVSDILAEEQGGTPAVVDDAARARGQILELAKPVWKDVFVETAAKVLARH